MRLLPQQERLVKSDKFQSLMISALTGGGKTYALVASALRHIDKPGYAAIILRKTYSQLKVETVKVIKEILDAEKIDYKYDALNNQFKFPSGAVLFLGSLSDSHDYLRYLSLSVNQICFDNLSEFTEEDYNRLLSRARNKTEGVPNTVKATVDLRNLKPWMANVDEFVVADFSENGCPERK